MKGNWRRYALSTLVLVAAAAAPMSPGARAADSQRRGNVLDLVVKSGRLSVRVHGARLAEVLEAVGRQAGVKIVLRGDLATPVTQSFTDLPLDEGISRLTRGHSVVLIYHPTSEGAKSGVLSEAWVTAFSGTAVRPEARAQPTPRSVVSGDAQAQIGLPTPPVASNRRPLQGNGSRAADRAGASDLISALKDKEDRVRVQAIQPLVMEQGTQAVGALRDVATNDPAPHVRRAAIRALASMNTDEARDALGAALGDRDPVVRAAAVRAFARWRDLPR